MNLTPREQQIKEGLQQALERVTPSNPSASAQTVKVTSGTPRVPLNQNIYTRGH